MRRERLNAKAQRRKAALQEAESPVVGRRCSAFQELATNWSSGTYSYDGAGNIVKVGSDYYLYDPVSRLTVGNIAAVTQKQCHVYDAFGNMLRVDVIASGSTCPTTGSWSVDAASNRFLSPVTYADTGNETSRAGKTYAWDALNELKTMSGTGINRAYLYTVDGERIVDRDTNANPNVTTVTVRDLSGKVLRIMTKTASTWAWSKDYVSRNGALLAEVEMAAPSEPRHFALDHLGTPRLITRNAGTVVATHTYFPFGQEATGTADGERMKFTGHERDGYSSMVYMHARYYTEGVARFASLDPGRDNDAHDPQSWNLYSYVRNNPMNRTDPTGRWIGWDDLIFSAGGGLVGLAGQYLGNPHSTGADLFAAAVGGAVAGEVLLYTSPLSGPFGGMAAGATGAAVTNTIKQWVALHNGAQQSFRLGSLALDTGLGMAFGALPGARIPGITAGRGSAAQVASQMVTKKLGGTIGGVTLRTAEKMFVGRAAETSLLEGTAYGATVEATGSKQGFTLGLRNLAAAPVVQPEDFSGDDEWRRQHGLFERKP